ncbi:hypothetical protein AAFF_G00371080 [Aldrovandia affinis]|uniref:Linker for activation of T-cells family member 2 n=1 Tax=Aldrovandia affinis TaxID=143900 RepID=A0AAD7SH35_9TELE|nr:hypothetical protein AAFF_G00371080 [Aldrovandia affinis]
MPTPKASNSDSGCSLTVAFGQSLASPGAFTSPAIAKHESIPGPRQIRFYVTQVMTALFSQQEAGLAVASLVSLGVLCAMCLKCRKISRVFQEENSIYNPEIVREGRRFTVTRSTTVRLNQTRRDLPPTPEETPEVICATQMAPEDQDYEDLDKSQLGDFETTYVNPIPNLVYQNVTDIDKDVDTYSYENVFPTLDAISEDADSSDYTNTSFLEEMKKEEDEPDYVNIGSEIKT